MRRIIQLSVACLAASVVSACSGRDAVTDTGVAPTGGVRFINAVPDSAGGGGLDFRFIDLVENNAHYNIPFRNDIQVSGGIPASTKIQFKATEAGDRHFRIFLDDDRPAVASQRIGCAADATTCIGDSTITVEDQHRYTALLWGNARGGALPLRLTIIDEETAGCADPGSQVGYRGINAMNSAVDVRVYTNTQVQTDVAVTTKSKDASKAASTKTTTTTTNTPIPATPTWTLQPLTVSPTCVNLDPTPNTSSVVVGSKVTLSDTTTSVTTVTTTITVKYNVQPAGGGTALFSDASALIGIPNGTEANGCVVGLDCDATPGSSVAGTALSAIIFPPSVAGSMAAQFDSPAISFMWDRRPPRNPGT